VRRISGGLSQGEFVPSVAEGDEFRLVAEAAEDPPLLRPWMVLSSQEMGAASPEWIRTSFHCL
jgi:hypothetical protein